LETKEKTTLLTMQQQEALTLFSDFTHIALHQKTTCSQACTDFACKNCTQGMADKPLPTVTLQLCPAGCFRLFIHLASDADDAVSLSSEPLCCFPFTEQAVQENTLCHKITLLQLDKALRLLSHLLPHSMQSSPVLTIQDKAPCDTAEISACIEQAIMQIVTKNGTDFNQIRLDFVRFIVALYAYINENPVSRNFHPTQTQLSRLALCRTLGELKSYADDLLLQYNKSFHSKNSYHQKLVQNACFFIEEHYNKKLSQNVVARHVFLSPSYFSGIFKEVTGCSFNQYVNRLRIQKAKELLCNPALSISEIHQLVGYENASYFGKMFHQVTGQTPSEYQQSLRL